MNLLTSIRSRSSPRSESRSLWPYDTMSMGGMTYPLGLPGSTSLSFKQEDIGGGYLSYAHMAMMQNPIVFACMEYRRKTFSQAYFQWQQLRGGTPGKFFGNNDLAILERPWMNATTPDLLNQAIQAADLGGNGIIVRRSGRLKVLRPDWVSIIAASNSEPEQGATAIDADIAGYAYWPGGKASGAEPEILLPEEVAHFAPTPDPTASFRGMSWLTPAIRDIMGDQAASLHKLKYFENGATGTVVVKLDPTIVNDLAKFDAWVEKLEQGHKGVANAYKTWYLGAAADPQVIGANLRQEDFAVTQSAGARRIAGDAGVPAILVGVDVAASADMAYYKLARRSYIDSTLWDMWGNIAGALQSVLPTPPGARLWVDSRHIPLMQEDQRDRAEIQQTDASAINVLIMAGFEPDAAVDAVVAGDLARLAGNHTGMLSVQMQKPGTGQEPDDADAPDDEEPARSRVDAARHELVASGVVRPTDAQVAEKLGVSERTLRRWRTGV